MRELRAPRVNDLFQYVKTDCRLLWSPAVDEFLYRVVAGERKR